MRAIALHNVPEMRSSAPLNPSCQCFAGLRFEQQNLRSGVFLHLLCTLKISGAVVIQRSTNRRSLRCATLRFGRDDKGKSNRNPHGGSSPQSPTSRTVAAREACSELFRVLTAAGTIIRSRWGSALSHILLCMSMVGGVLAAGLPATHRFSRCVRLAVLSFSAQPQTSLQKS